MAVGAGRPASTKEPQRRVVIPVSGVTTLLFYPYFGESLCIYMTINGLFINKIHSASPPRLRVRLCAYSDEDQTLRARALNILGLNSSAHPKISLLIPLPEEG